MRYRAFIVTLLAFCLSVLTACSEAPAASTEGLTYEQTQAWQITAPKLKLHLAAQFRLKVARPTQSPDCVCNQHPSSSKKKPPASVAKLSLSQSS